MKIFSFVTIWLINTFQLNASIGSTLSLGDVFRFDAEDNQVKRFNENFNKNPSSILLISKFHNVDFNILRSATVVIPLKSSSFGDRNFIEILTIASKVLLTSLDDDLSLNETEKYLQKFLKLHKTSKIFIAQHNKIYFFNPFAFDVEAKAFGKIQANMRSKEQNSKLFTLRVELFPSTYSNPKDWRNWTAFEGPDISIARIVMKEMNMEGEIDLSLFCKL